MFKGLVVFLSINRYLAMRLTSIKLKMFRFKTWVKSEK